MITIGEIVEFSECSIKQALKIVALLHQRGLIEIVTISYHEDGTKIETRPLAQGPTLSTDNNLKYEFAIRRIPDDR